MSGTQVAKSRNFVYRQLMGKDFNYKEVSDEFWEEVEPLIGKLKRKRPGGKPQIPPRKIFNGVLFKLKTGCQWNMIPDYYGSKSTIHEHFQRWVRSGIFDEIMRIYLLKYDDSNGLGLQWQSMDGSIIQAPVRAEKKR